MSAFASAENYSQCKGVLVALCGLRLVAALEFGATGSFASDENSKYKASQPHKWGALLRLYVYVGVVGTGSKPHLRGCHNRDFFIWHAEYGGTRGFCAEIRSF